MGKRTNAQGKAGLRPDAAAAMGAAPRPIPPPPMSEAVHGVIVARDALVAEVLRQVASRGIVIICAPDGFGKTSLMLQVAAAARTDTDRAAVRLIGAGGLTAHDVLERLTRVSEEISGAPGALVLLDDLRVRGSRELEGIAGRLRALREAGVTVVVSCPPAARALVNELGDSHKMGPSALTVQPSEFRRWSQALSLSHELDGYGLTRGIPLLVSALRAVVEGEDGKVHLSEQAAALYRAVLAEVEGTRGSLSRLIPMLLLLERGSFADLERCGMRARGEVLNRLQREYPVFAIDAEGRGFSCLGADGPAMTELRGEIIRRHPELHVKAVRVHIRARRVDRAIELMRRGFSKDGKLDMIGSYPAAFACAGRADFVRTTVNGVGAERAAVVGAGVVLALYLSSLLVGDYRMARTTSAELCRRAAEVVAEVDPVDWGAALAFREVWGTCVGIDLPELPADYLRKASNDQVRRLREHVRVHRSLVGGAGEVPKIGALSSAPAPAPDADELDIPHLLLEVDRELIAAFHDPDQSIDRAARSFSSLANRLGERRLVPLAVRVRAASSLRRLFAGSPVVDERAFSDMVTVAVRESDQDTQLLYMAAEGWQCVGVGQLVNARFRAQQVRKLIEPGHALLNGWSLLLEQVAVVLNSSRVTVREEADLIDLSRITENPAEAWAVALLLAAAQYDTDLSVWYSLHRDVLLDPGFLPIARLALGLMGQRAGTVFKLIPDSLADSYRLAPEPVTERHPDLTVMPELSEMGQVGITLFGGFQVSRNGHQLTNRLWSRKRSGFLAARLALSLGTFVGRHTLMSELWPGAEVSRARQNLYTATSTLRSAFGQVKEGPQYVLTHGDGMGLNAEYVSADVTEFDMLVRSILLHRDGRASSPRALVDACLKLEKLYLGPLYVPGSGDVTFFTRMQRVYESKFVDCLVRGFDAAMEEQDTTVATWLAEAALKQCPTREDVLRRAMRALDSAGRRREVVNLYSSHLYYLRHELEDDLNREPEAETRRLYEEIVDGSGLQAFI
ncbi:MAG: BTAD domain-containing putative transcriptional regulator [Collinsella sp.]|nr:BTAD domain-containing putative transcriptional regulator [Collinsella sp.]